jgi:ribonuclease P protein subunit POP4
MKKTLYPHELIGEDVEIVESNNQDQIGIKGKVVDETKSTLNINGKVLLKNSITIKLLSSGEVISGKEIAKRPEDRIKGK